MSVAYVRARSRQSIVSAIRKRVLFAIVHVHHDVPGTGPTPEFLLVSFFYATDPMEVPHSVVCIPANKAFSHLTNVSEGMGRPDMDV